MKTGVVIVQNRTNAEVALRYVDKDNNRAQRNLPPRGTFELCPKRTDVNKIKFSNVKDLIKRRAIRIVVEKKGA
jgi:hypothetical protein